MIGSSFLDVVGLRTTFKTPNGPVHVVDDVSFSVKRGEAVGIVGESGSGKTMTIMSIMGLLPHPVGQITSGEVRFKGESLLKMSDEKRRLLRGGEMSMIFQDPMSSLSPFYSVGYQIVEAILCHQKVSSGVAWKRAEQLMADVGIPEVSKRVKQYPHQFSGGMRQRIMIAMALANDPEMLFADEPTTALDVTIQAQILSLIAEKRRQKGMSLVLISHDWGVVSSLCDRIIVMYGGRIMEEGPALELWDAPKHPYTQALLKSVPHWDMEKSADLFVIPGNPPVSGRIPPGCPFAPRCIHARGICHAEVPAEKVIGPNRRYRCILD